MKPYRMQCENQPVRVSDHVLQSTPKPRANARWLISPMQKCTILFASLVLSMGAAARGAEVSASLSARETYVGNPIVLRIEIANASSHDEPKLPTIDGVDIREVGTPSRSSHVSIINGHRTEHVSVTYAWRLTPRRAGSFTVPAIEVRADGQTLRTRPLRFSATKSETGDLLFVEIAGDQDQIYVGQPMALTLRIWVRPYSNSQLNVTLSEVDMWQMISREKSNWGIFADRLNEMASNDERPGGREVSRADADGVERRYFLYEIDATVYPKRPGQIDGDEVQIVVDYPTQLGKSRGPFDSFFDDDTFFGGRLPSVFRNEMPSMFGPRLRVTEARPVVASAEVKATVVLPVPTKDRPRDYRGSVGRYKIVAQASPTNVKAGDPITLHLGIQGDGPMDLVQAPPLSQFPELTADFKVAEDPLAGFVKDDVKLFTASIRPRRKGITQIPAIPFSYFDPEEAKFVTVYSEPISITVEAADQLALDSIVGGRTGSDRSQPSNAGANDARGSTLRLDNYAVDEILKSDSRLGIVPTTSGLLVPPLLFAAAWLVRHARAVQLPSFRSQNDLDSALNSIRSGQTPNAISHVLMAFVASRLGVATSVVTSNSIRDFLKANSVSPELLGDVEATITNCEQASYAGLNTVDMPKLRDRASDCIRRLSDELPSPRSLKSKTTSSSHALQRTATAAAVLLSLTLFQLAPQHSGAAEPNAIALTKDQQTALLEEANSAYAEAGSSADSADGRQSFEVAARKYQTLVDSGLSSDRLYFNLGNAYLQSGSIGRAIASYEQAIALNPASPARLNLQHARELANLETQGTHQLTVASVISTLRRWNAIVSPNTKTVAFVASWILLWLLATAATLRCKLHSVRLVIPAAVAVGILATTLGIDYFSWTSADRAIVVVPDAILREGNGESFSQVDEASEGTAFEIEEKRGPWLRVAPGGNWIHETAIVTVSPRVR